MSNISEKFEKFYNKNCSWREKDRALCMKRPDGTLKKITPQDAATRYLQACIDTAEDPGCSFEDIVKWVISKQPAPKGLKAVPQTLIPGLGQVVSWINEQLKDPICPYSISLRGDFVKFCSNNVEISSTDKKIVAWLNQRVRDLDLKRSYTVGDITNGWDLYKDHRMAIAKASVRNGIEYNGSVFIDEFLKYIYDYLQIKEDYDVYEMIFKHWLWCLKRRIFDKSVIWHIWINFNGAQGIGKTQMLNRMFKFIEDFIITTNLRIMNDIDREYRKFTDNYILIFDDLNT